MKTSTKKFASSLALLALLAACGKADKELSDADRMVEDAEEAAARAAADGSNIQGHYVANFITLNGQVNGTVPGAAVLRRIDNKLNIYLRFSLGSPSVGHFQNIHVGRRCPTLADDTNGDGFIDYPEAIAVVGPALIPLDSDISSQMALNRFWPKAFENGSYEYNEQASFNHFWSDLKAPDKNPDDHITKLAPDEGFPVTGRVVMVQGVSDKPIFNGVGVENSPLPATVAGYKRYQGYQVFPVTCGVFMPDSGPRGTEHVDTPPTNVAPIEEGQDQPAPVGAGEVAGDGTVIMGPTNSSGSNDAGSTETDGTTTGGTTGTTIPDPTGTTTGSSAGGSSGGATTGSSTGGSSGSTTGGSTTGGSDYGDDEEEEEDDDWQWPWERLPRIVGGAESGNF